MQLQPSCRAEPLVAIKKKLSQTLSQAVTEVSTFKLQLPPFQPPETSLLSHLSIVR